MQLHVQQQIMHPNRTGNTGVSKICIHDFYIIDFSAYKKVLSSEWLFSFVWRKKNFKNRESKSLKCHNFNISCPIRMHELPYTVRRVINSCIKITENVKFCVIRLVQSYFSADCKSQKVNLNFFHHFPPHLCSQTKIYLHDTSYCPPRHLVFIFVNFPFNLTAQAFSVRKYVKSKSDNDLI